MKILVVDDEKAICEILEEFLSIFGHTVASANRGEDALARLGESDFDVVFPDIRMPGVSGLEVLKEIKELVSGRVKGRPEQVHYPNLRCNKHSLLRFPRPLGSHPTS